MYIWNLTWVRVKANLRSQSAHFHWGLFYPNLFPTPCGERRSSMVLFEAPENPSLGPGSSLSNMTRDSGPRIDSV